MADIHRIRRERFSVAGVTLLVLLSVGLWCASEETLPVQATGDQAAPETQFLPSDSSVEHMDRLALGYNGLHADPPLLGESVSLPKYTRELFRVQWRPHDPIDLYVIRPAGVPKPPVVLFLYGFPSESDRFRSEELCEKLTRDGFAAVGFVSAMTGQRYHDRPMKEWFVSEMQESLVTSVHDVQMILNYLDSRGDLDMNRVGMFGQGSGGTIAILSAAVDQRIKAVDVMDPWGDWPDWLAKSPQIPEEERGQHLTPEFLAKIAPFDPVRWLYQLNTRPVRVQENLFNAAVPERVRIVMEGAVSANASIVEYRDLEEYKKKVSSNGKMLDWLHLQLRLSSQKSPSAKSPML
jgi:pimeloyl-ACP methyl ester carboxylesterase